MKLDTIIFLIIILSIYILIIENYSFNKNKIHNKNNIRKTNTKSINTTKNNIKNNILEKFEEDNFDKLNDEFNEIEYNFYMEVENKFDSTTQQFQNELKNTIKDIEKSFIFDNTKTDEDKKLIYHYDNLLELNNLELIKLGIKVYELIFEINKEMILKIDSNNFASYNQNLNILKYKKDSLSDVQEYKNEQIKNILNNNYSENNPWNMIGSIKENKTLHQGKLANNLTENNSNYYFIPFETNEKREKYLYTTTDNLELPYKHKII